MCKKEVLDPFKTRKMQNKYPSTCTLQKRRRSKKYLSAADAPLSSPKASFLPLFRADFTTTGAPPTCCTLCPPAEAVAAVLLRLPAFAGAESRLGRALVEVLLVTKKLRASAAFVTMLWSTCI